MDTFLLERGPLGSRGTTIITQKENKGEYYGIHCDSETSCSGGHLDNGSIWYWNNLSYDWDIYTHVFDQNGPNDPNNSTGIPYRYPAAKAPNDWDWAAGFPSNAICDSDNSTTSTKIHGNPDKSTLYSGTEIKDQKSCNPNTLNAGNLYNFPAATAGSDMRSKPSYPANAPNSICPKGWQLPPDSGSKSYETLVYTAYKIPEDASSDAQLLISPLSFVRLGFYLFTTGSLYGRGIFDGYWSSGTDILQGYNLSFNPSMVNPRSIGDRSYGQSIRCVSR